MKYFFHCHRSTHLKGIRTQDSTTFIWYSYKLPKTGRLERVAVLKIAPKCGLKKLTRPFNKNGNSGKKPEEQTSGCTPCVENLMRS